LAIEDVANEDILAFFLDGISWVIIEISLPAIYIMVKMIYALTLADSHAS